MLKRKSCKSLYTISTTDGYNSCREALEQLQHGLGVTRRRHLQERLEAGLKQAQNNFWNDRTESDRIRFSQLGSHWVIWVSLLIQLGSDWLGSAREPMMSMSARVGLSQLPIRSDPALQRVGFDHYRVGFWASSGSGWLAIGQI